MTTDLTRPFILNLAKPPISWPLITRDGREAEVLKWDAEGVYPIIGHIEGYFKTWKNDGKLINGLRRCEEDLLLSTDPASPKVREAVQRCHAAGMEIWATTEGDGNWMRVAPDWNWKACIYLPACLVPDAGAKETPSEEPMECYACGRSFVPVAGKPLASPVPWKLGRTVNGFTLPDGREWHRHDFTEADLPEGTRPLMDSEIDGKWHKDISWKSEINKDGWLNSGSWHTSGHGWFRTRRPIPAPPVLVPWECADVPPFAVFRHKLNSCAGPMISIQHDGIWLWYAAHNDDAKPHLADWKLLAASYEHSTDGRAWHPCSKLSQ